MIFVTVGTHEQPFERLIKWTAELQERGGLKDEVVIQTGYSQLSPKNCVCQPFFSPKEMTSFYEKADLVVCHGGPATFMSVLALGKVPIIVPRLQRFGEHINDHQWAFAQFLKSQQYPIEVIGAHDKKLFNDVLQNPRVCQKFSWGREFTQKLVPLVDELMKRE